MTEQGEIPVGVDVPVEKAKKDYAWIPVSLPKELVARIDAISSAQNRKRAGYVRAAVVAQLEKDEATKDVPDPGAPL